MDGTVLSSLEDPALQWPRCIHMSETGQLLVCGYSNNVFQVDGEGGLVTLASDQDGLNGTESVYYIARTGMLIVGHTSNDMLLINTK
ncbi:hypothetical protein DPMN_087007 [Dreissena polymorpha]|uniref:Uncharacterized protein n=2 Tax=Dreissena polymorpha TaxID=45954 RepID=A0A9D4KRF7_DREPO|nr:hypothetical protein DPMN_087007 [Dreissena polymorpha]